MPDSSSTSQGARFPFGHVVATPAALAALTASGENAVHFLARHLRGDWGDLDPADQHANDQALQCGGRLFSAYTLSTSARLWIITEADRSSTCLLLPDDY
jgi:hypothetical protein